MAHTIKDPLHPDDPFSPRFRFPFTHPESKRTTKQVAQRCPVCEGRGSLPCGFYSGATSATSLNADECRTCWGSGVLYVQESTG